jgi:ABC-type polysaccharide/polyol phosphate transport system ATPase subunit
MSEQAGSVQVRGLWKDFTLQRGQLTAFHLIRRSVRRSDTQPVLHALQNINLDVRPGELVGFVGDNGAGKTTLLKSIAGIYTPTRGQVTVRGQVGLLSGLGVGMVGDLPVCDNIHLYGSICRLSRSRLDALFDEILDWAELRDFVYEPVRNLSAGMRTRLAFAVAMRTETQVLLIDEVLSAGDQRFRQKCQAYFESLRQGDKAVLIATHDLDFVERNCQKTLWLRSGQQVGFGPTAEIVTRYREDAS